MIETEHSSSVETAEESPPAVIEPAEAEDANRVSVPGGTPEMPRRRLVAELLAGQEDVEESVRRDSVKAQLHLETIDAGQPIYQLDLSSEEPQGTMVESTRMVDPDADDEPPLTHQSAIAAAAMHNAVKQLVMQRDRQVMAAERDGVGAYELAVDLDVYVERIIDAVRRSGR